MKTTWRFEITMPANFDCNAARAPEFPMDFAVKLNAIACVLEPKFKEQVKASSEWVEPQALRFADAVDIAVGCLDYGGGHYADGKMDAFRHGIATVINALKNARIDERDMQTEMLRKIGIQHRQQAPATKE